MESVIDLTTTSFKAIAAVAVVFTAAYAYNGPDKSPLGRTLLKLSHKVLLPALIFVSLAASPGLSFKRLLQQWPSVVLNLITHAASLFFSVLYFHWQRGNKWLIEALTFNNVSSYPLLLLQALYLLSSETSGLSHLKWRVLDHTPIVLQRATEYLVLNLVITEGLRLAIVHAVPRGFAKDTPSAADEPETGVNGDGAVAAAEASADGATERTPLLAATSAATTSPAASGIPWDTIRTAYLVPIVLPAALGVLIGAIKPLQHALVGNVAEGTTAAVWSTAGYGLVLLGAAFAVVDILGTGAEVRSTEKNQYVAARYLANSSPHGVAVPPALGTVLVYTLWRFVAVPAISIGVVKAFRHIPSVHVYLQDPAYSFVLIIAAVSPPAALPENAGAFQSSVYFYVHYVALITSVVVAIAFSVAGRGIGSGVEFDLSGALKKALGGGLAGAAAMVVQVLTLMPLRTIMNYQYRYGGSIKEAVSNLWNDGGFFRYYAGFWAAIFQGPLSRFGDTAANVGILALLSSVDWPVLVKTVVASLASATFRMTLTPIDTLKTTQQTKGGKAGLKLLRERIRENGIGCLWWGALATAAATFVGHYPWFATYNYLAAVLPLPDTVLQKLARQAFIGFAASVASDTISNSLRVVKTYRQVHEEDVGYWTAAKEIVATEGLPGLFGRGLPTRLVTNGLQGLLFSILWKLFMDIFTAKNPA
ncbi:hypothetical protein Q8F55_003282 [Vanrija albida]|uniref:Mitochondrial carrier protein n=1 Tax=Vanrija albida TaxID=181172 RepID=A0ABR3Q3R8_9TREE